MCSITFCVLFLGPGNFCLVHVSLVPVLSVVGEQVISCGFDIFREGSLYQFVTVEVSTSVLQKTKPTQHSVKGLRSLGLTPNILACRSTKVIDCPILVLTIGLQFWLLILSVLVL